MNLGRLDDEIKKLLKEQDKALSVNTLSVLTGEPTWKISKKIKKMEKNGDIKLHKSMKIRFYRPKD